MYQEIIDAKQLVEDMKYGLPYFKDDAKKEKQINRINTVIKLINLADRLSKGSEDIEMINVMTLHILKEKYKNLITSDGFEGFISEVWFKSAAKSVGFDLYLGYDNIKKQLALMFSGDMLAQADFLTEAEKECNIYENPKTREMFGDSVKMWMDNIQYFVNVVNDKRTQKYIDGVN